MLSPIINMIVKKAVSDYPESIAIIIIYGSASVETQTPFSDIDMFAIFDPPKEQEIISKPRYDIIFQGQPISLWCWTWKEAETQAKGEDLVFPDIWAVAGGIFLHNTIVYARSQEDREKFSKLTNLVEECKLNTIGNKMLALRSFNQRFWSSRLELAKKYKDILFARWYGWELLNMACMWLSRLNNTPYSKNWGSVMVQVFKLPKIPSHLKENSETLIASDNIDEIYKAGKCLVLEIREILVQEQLSLSIPPDLITNSEFVHIKEYIGKIKSACTKKDIFLASYAASELQLWTSELLAREQGKYIVYNNLIEESSEYYNSVGLPDLSRFISSRDYQGLSKAIDEFDKKIFQHFQKSHPSIPVCETLRDVEVYFQQNKP